MAANRFWAITPAVFLAAALASPLSAGATVTVKPTSQSFMSNGATGNVAVAFTGMSSASATITASTTSNWITVTSLTPSNGTVPIRKGKGAGKVSYRVAKNGSSLSRTDVLTVNGTNVTVTQGGVPCKLALSAVKATVTASGGETSLSVTAPDGCGWSAATDSSWATIASGSSGSGSGSVSISVAANSTVKPQTGKVTLTASDPVTGKVSDKKTFVLTQAKGSGGSPTPTPTPASVTALKVAAKVTVVDAKQPTAATATALVLKAADIQTDFQKDATQVYVDESSAKAFDTVNNILCMIAQSRYDQMLNKGVYAALIDENLCNGGGGQATQAQQAQSSAPSYKNWTVNSSRTDDGSPQSVKAWIHETQGQDNTPVLISANLQITEASSATNPYGIFSMNFIGNPITAGGVDTSTTLMKGTLSAVRDQTGKVFLKFIENDQSAEGQGSKAATLFKLTDGTGGGSIQQTGTEGTGSSNFAFNDNFFHRVSDSDDACLNRNAFDQSSSSYGLYDTAGARVNVNSGFPIKIGSNTTAAYGWVGYWGLWLPNNVTVSNGDAVYRQSFNGTPDTTPYTILKAGGKLMKHQRYTTTLGAIKNIPLSMWLNSGPNGQGNYNVQWNGSAFVITGWMPMNSGNGSWQNLPSPSNLDLSSLQMSELNFWSDGLGQGMITLACTASAPVPGQPPVFSCGSASDANQVIYYSQDIVYPGDAAPSTFACLENCPDATKLSQAQPMKQDVQGMQNVPPTKAAFDTYTFDASRMVLKDGTNDVIATQTAVQGGVMSGPLFDPTDPNNITALACDWNATQTCGWQAGSRLNLFYTWQTGSDSWNQLTLLKSADGSALRFDPPLYVHYTHTQTDTTQSDARYNGVQFRLEYDGFGQLQGIPATCISRSTGAVIDCSQSGSDTSWVSDFTINAGETVTAETGGATYMVKPLEIDEHMKTSAAANCTSLPATATYQLPSIGDWTNPNIGSEPSVTAPPAVIGGVLQ